MSKAGFVALNGFVLSWVVVACGGTSALLDLDGAAGAPSEGTGGSSSATGGTANAVLNGGTGGLNGMGGTFTPSGGSVPVLVGGGGTTVVSPSTTGGAPSLSPVLLGGMPSVVPVRTGGAPSVILPTGGSPSFLTGGTGGIVNTGGTPPVLAGGTGAVPNTGGLPGTGGIPNTGGLPGTGGIPNTGGLPGTGGIPDLPEVQLPEGCELSYTWVYSEGCDMEWNCGSGWLYSSCWEMGDNTSYCNCDSNSITTELELEGTNAASSCEYVAGVCAGVTTPQFGETEECEIVYQYSYSDMCQIQRDCSKVAVPAEGVIASQHTWYSTTCDHYNTTSWACQCNHAYSDSTTSFELPTDYEYDTVCPVALSICDGVDSIVPEGGMTCEPSYLSATDTWCDSSMTCSQAATIEGKPLKIQQSLYVYCSEQDADSGEWQCTCGLGNDSVEFAMTTEDGWDACPAAADQCATELVPTE